MYSDWIPAVTVTAGQKGPLWLFFMALAGVAAIAHAIYLFRHPSYWRQFPGEKYLWIPVGVFLIVLSILIALGRVS